MEYYSIKKLMEYFTDYRIKPQRALPLSDACLSMELLRFSLGVRTDSADLRLSFTLDPLRECFASPEIYFGLENFGINVVSLRKQQQLEAHTFTLRTSDTSRPTTKITMQIL